MSFIQFKSQHLHNTVLADDESCLLIIKHQLIFLGYNFAYSFVRQLFD